MTTALVFLVATLASLFDPIGLAAYILAGSLIRNYFAAIVVGILCRVLLYLIFIAPAMERLQSSVSTLNHVAALFAAAIATSAAYYVASRIRSSRAANSSGADQDSL